MMDEPFKRKITDKISGIEANDFVKSNERCHGVVHSVKSPDVPGPSAPSPDEFLSSSSRSRESEEYSSRFLLRFSSRLRTYFSQCRWLNSVRSSYVANFLKYFINLSNSWSVALFVCAFRNGLIRSPFLGFIIKFLRISSNMIVFAGV